MRVTKQASALLIHRAMSTASKDFWRIVCISDTHSLYSKMADIPEGDILIHAGDFSRTGTLKEMQEFRSFIDNQSHPLKIFIAGNHDITMHKEFYTSQLGCERFHNSLYREKGFNSAIYADECIAAVTNGVRVSDFLPDTSSLVYLENKSFEIPRTEISPPLSVYGSPWQPEFYDWAFNYPHNGREAEQIWSKIPDNTDILITHGPPYDILDRCDDGNKAGCPILRRNIDERIRPRLHIFGHIHEAYGVKMVGDTLFVNPSTCTLRYRPTNPAIVIDLPFDRMLPPRCSLLPATDMRNSNEEL